MTRKKEAFKPINKGKVDFYSCGPTVYNVVHIGNLRSFLCADTLYRWLRFGLGYTVRWVMNITDVDDKTIRDSQKEYSDRDSMEALLKFTRHYEELFFEDLEKLNIPQKNFYQILRATESIEGMQELIRKIFDNNIGYEKDGSIYFSIEKYVEKKKEKYGKLVTLDLNALKTGTRTLNDEIEKENAQDFVLWKGEKEGEPCWDFDLHGKNYPGRPGWHIECSAMEKAAFGELPFDIHSGGVDLCFPHHEDEIAQSTAGYGQNPTNYWVHNEHLMIEGRKMSKSLGNFYTLQDLIKKGHSEETIRFFLVSNHYRTKLNLSEDALKATYEGLQRIRNFCRSMKSKVESQKSKENPPDKGDLGGLHENRRSEIRNLISNFRDALNDDLNTPKAVAVLFDALNVMNPDKTQMREFFQYAEQIFGVRFLPQEVDIPEEVVNLAKARQKAKKEKNFDKADKLRQEIVEHGFQVRDVQDGFEILPQEL